MRTSRTSSFINPYIRAGKEFKNNWSNWSKWSPPKKIYINPFNFFNYEHISNSFRSYHERHLGSTS